MDESKYGNFTTLTAASAVLKVDCVALDKTDLGESNLDFFSGGSRSLKPANEIYEGIIENPTEVPLFVISFNGERGAGGAPSLGGHYLLEIPRRRWPSEFGPAPPLWLTDEAAAEAVETTEARAEAEKATVDAFGMQMPSLTTQPAAIRGRGRGRGRVRSRKQIHSIRPHPLSLVSLSVEQ